MEKLEAKIAALETKIEIMEKKLEQQENENRKLKDIEEIKRLQRAYGFYLEHWMDQEIIDLFSDSGDTSLTLGAGTYLGKQGVRRYFEHINRKKDPEFLHIAMQLSGIVDINPDGKTAKGRWYGFGAVALPRPEGVGQSFFGGVYSGDYVKEEGTWKILKLRFDEVFNSHPSKGWVRPDRVLEVSPQSQQDNRTVIPGLKVDIPRTVIFRYPSGIIVPFHYTHPVTGNESSEKKRNEALGVTI